MSYQSNDEPLPPGFTSLQTYRLMIPTEVALRQKVMLRVRLDC